MSLREWMHPGCLPIGVDIGAGSVRLLQMRRRRSGLSLVHAARADLPVSAREPESKERLEALTQTVTRLLDAGGFLGRACVLSIDDRALRVRSVRHPRIPDEELERAVQLDAPGRLGFAEGESAQFGWLRAGETRQGEELREEIIVVGARRQPIEELVFGLASRRVQPLAVEPGFLACARSFGRLLRRAVDQSIVRAIVDIGLCTTGVILMRGRAVTFYKQLEFGGERMTKAAAERLGMEPSAVAEMRRRRAAGGAPGDPRVDRAMFEAVRPLLCDLAQEVSLCVRYCGVTFRGARPESCLVVGGEAREPRLAEQMSEILHLPVSVGQPLHGVTPREGGGAEEVRPGNDCEWAVAAGLGLRFVEQRVWAKADRRRGEGGEGPGETRTQPARQAA